MPPREQPPAKLRWTGYCYIPDDEPNVPQRITWDHGYSESPDKGDAVAALFQGGRLVAVLVGVRLYVPCRGDELERIPKWTVDWSAREITVGG